MLAAMFFLAGGAALQESATVDEIAHIGAGLSYWQRLDLRLNSEHPPLAKALAALPLAIRGAHADYAGQAWRLSTDLFPSMGTEWVFGEAIVQRWNDWKSTLAWARFPMLLLMLLLGWFVYRYGTHLGGQAGGLLCLAAYIATPAFLTFGPLVLTDVPVTLFSLVALWQLGEVWEQPSRRNEVLFALALTAALLSKFTGLLLIPIILVLFIETRFWPGASEPRDQAARKAWRRARWGCVLRSVLWAALMVYAVYFLLSWNQPNDAPDFTGSGTPSFHVPRLLMPVWLYVRGMFLMLVMGSRPTFLLGRTYAHGVPYYFPIVFALKSTLGFLVLLVIAAAAGIASRHRLGAIPDAFRSHWRVLITGFFVYLAVCLLSQLDLSIRHFTVPIVLLILMLAPLPHLTQSLPRPAIWRTAIAAATAASFVAIVLAYPYFMPFVNSLSFGRPAYWLMNDSNVSWNESLPQVEKFAREHRLPQIELDWASVSDASIVVPQARQWDCQAPTDRDAGQWVAVAAVSILENHNCGYLQQYPRRQLAGGAFYVFQLPSPLPPAGTPGGPPPPAARKLLWGMPFDFRGWAVDAERNPGRIDVAVKSLMQTFREQYQQQQAARQKK